MNAKIYVTLIVTCLMLIGLSACDSTEEQLARHELGRIDTEKELNVSLQKDPGMKDCTGHVLAPGMYGSYVYTVRCPNSETTTNYQSGKNRRDSATIVDGK